MSCSSASSLTRPWIGRHDRLVAGDDLGRRGQDRLAEVGLVGHHGLAARRARTVPAEEAVQRGPARLRSPARWQVTQASSVKSFSPAAASDAGAGPPASQAWKAPAPSPRPSRSSSSARCRSTPRRRGGSVPACGLEPRRGVAAGHRVLLHAEGRHEEAVDTSSEVRVSFTGTPTGTCSSLISRWPVRCWTFHIQRLPTHVDLHGVVGARGSCGRRRRAPQTNITIAMSERDELQVSSSASEPWIAAGPVVLGERRRYRMAKTTSRQAMQQREERGERDQEEVEGVHRARDGGGLLGEEREAGAHGLGRPSASPREAACSCRHDRTTKPPRARTVSTPSEAQHAS